MRLKIYLVQSLQQRECFTGVDKREADDMHDFDPFGFIISILASLNSFPSDVLVSGVSLPRTGRKD